MNFNILLLLKNNKVEREMIREELFRNSDEINFVIYEGKNLRELK